MNIIRSIFVTLVLFASPILTQACLAQTATVSVLQAARQAMSQPAATPKPTFKIPTPVPFKRRLFLRESDFQIWSPVYIWAQKDRVRGMLEVNPRIGVGTGQFDQLLLRPAAGYQLSRTTSVWQGYAWTPSWLPRYLNENRIFQQLLIENRFGRWGLVNRTRLEERSIDHVDRTALRLRHFVRVTVPIKRESKWQLVGQEEIFINLNKVNAAITPGINQNRVFLGVNRQLHRKLNMDFGYQYQYINRNDPVEDRHNHVLLINTYYTI